MELTDQHGVLVSAARKSPAGDGVAAHRLMFEYSNLGGLVNTTICVSNPLGNFALPSNTHGQTNIATTAA